VREAIRKFNCARSAPVSIDVLEDRQMFSAWVALKTPLQGRPPAASMQPVQTQPADLTPARAEAARAASGESVSSSPTLPTVGAAAPGGNATSSTPLTAAEKAAAAKAAAQAKAAAAREAALEKSAAAKATALAKAAAAKAAALAKAAAAKAAALAKAAAAKAAAAATKTTATAEAALAKAASTPLSYPPANQEKITKPLTLAQVRNLVGDWSGTMLADGSTTDSPMSVTFTANRGITDTGTFTFGKPMNNQVVISTLVFGEGGSFTMMISTPTMGGGLVGVATSDGSMIVARWACNSGSGWATGTLTLTRN
jgi:hypothetical protein